MTKKKKKKKKNLVIRLPYRAKIFLSDIKNASYIYIAQHGLIIYKIRLIYQSLSVN